jgi:galactose-1-phosphate uridylyltransferase
MTEVAPPGVRFVGAGKVGRLGAPAHRRIPVALDPAGTPELLIIEQEVMRTASARREVVYSIPDALGVNGDTQIGRSRANRIMGVSEPDVGPGTVEPVCPFCGVADREAALDQRAAYREDNPRPFAPGIHQVVLTDRPVHTLDGVRLGDIRDAYEQFFELAADGGGRIDGVTIGMNWGDLSKSGASQLHFHYQVGGLGPDNFNAGDLIGYLCAAYRAAWPGRDYFTDYVGGLERAGLVLERNAHALLCVPVAQRFRNEMQIIVEPTAGTNILETTTAARAAVAELEYRAVRIYNAIRMAAKARQFNYNIVWYATRFSAGDTAGQRLVISLYPRTSVYAFYELSQNYVIDEFPWTCAANLRSAGQSEERKGGSGFA